jgi:hypothetical protein
MGAIPVLTHPTTMETAVVAAGRLVQMAQETMDLLDHPHREQTLAERVDLAMQDLVAQVAQVRFKERL